ncbi:hypothetical protein [Thalassotalea montiporae]
MLSSFLPTPQLVKARSGLSILSCLFLLSACGSSSDDSSDIGYIQLYNASANAPAIYMTVDEDPEEDSDDEIERTYTAVDFTNVSSRNELPTDSFFVDLGWQSEDSNDHDDLTIIYEQEIAIESNMINFLVLAGDITAPSILSYNIPIVDDEDDSTDDLFNLRVLNLHANFDNLDVYVSKSSETFNEAELLDSTAYTELTINHKLAQDDYTFYITENGGDEVLFQSEEVPFQYTSQYVLAVRENLGVDSTPFVIDVISSSNATEYQQLGSTARFRAYNAIQLTEQLAIYQGEFDLFMDTADQEATIESLAIGQFSDAIATAYGDYSFALTLPDSSEQLLKNHLVTLTENADRTVFFYASEEFVDEDGDGDVDENGDGIVDEIDVTINSLVVSNSSYQGIYQHNVNIVNLIDDEDFGSVNVYFVRSDELIETAEYKDTIAYASNESMLLLNNTYQVYVVAQVNSSDVILATQSLTLDEDSAEQYLILTNDVSSATGYTMTFADQKPQT